MKEAQRTYDANLCAGLLEDNPVIAPANLAAGFLFGFTRRSNAGAGGNILINVFPGNFRLARGMQRNKA
jgi:hypothetical protein